MIPMTSSGMPTSIKVSNANPAEDRVEMMVSGCIVLAHSTPKMRLVDRDQRRQDQDRSAAEGTLERLGLSLETGGDRRRHVKICRGLFYRRHRRTNGAVRREVETQRHRRELALVVDRQGSGADGGELGRRDHAAGSGPRIDSAKSVWPKLVARIDFEDDVVFIQGRINPRHMALTKGVVENGIDQGGIDSETGSDVPVDLASGSDRRFVDRSRRRIVGRAPAVSGAEWAPSG
jgi:hypothetical protein